MTKFQEIDINPKKSKTAIGNSLPRLKYSSWNEEEKWMKKYLEAKILKQKTIRIFGMPRLVRPPFQEYCIVSRYYGPAKVVPLIYRAEEMFPSSEGIPQI